MQPNADVLEGPLVTVIMPVYNVERYVADSIASILNQTYRNIELLVFNDGSTDQSAAVVAGIKDPRLIFINSEQNFGCSAHMNTGFKMAKGKYIARMDSDDVSLPERLAKQVAFMEAHPEVGVCGTLMNIMDHPEIREVLPITDAEIRLYMLANSPLANPTVLLRTSVIQAIGAEYDNYFAPSEDYRIFHDLIPHTQFANLPEPLLDYRRHEGQISNYKSNRQRDRADDIRALQLRHYGFDLTPTEFETYCKFVDNYLRPLETADYGPMKPLMDKLVTQNRQLQAFPDAEFEAFVHRTWQTAIYNVKQYSLGLLQPVFGTSTRVANDALGLNVALRTAVKSLLRWKMRV